MASTTAAEAPKKEKKEKKDKKEKKEKKSKRSKTESETPADEPTTTAAAEETPKSSKESSKKRKRSALPEDGELEVDITAPEPLSKREQRLAKKGKLDPSTKAAKAAKAAKPSESESDGSDKEDGDEDAADAKKRPQREKKEKSPHGVWIGNLPWSATRDTIREFFDKHAGIAGERITRIHMPAPDKAAVANMRFKPHNRGFAYVDFDGADAVKAAIEASETLISGRACLIKDASNFEGRPQKKEGEADADGFTKFSKTAAVQAGGGKEPNKRVFVGNLSFDATRDDLIAHYSKCGEVADVFMATFQDTGKCKGYAWVTFETLDAAAAAVAGYVMIPGDDDSDEEMEDADNADGAGEKKKKKKKKARKWFVNRLEGRELRVEYAEDASTRYRKRYGKERETGNAGAGDEQLGEVDAPRQHPKSRREPRKVDARNIRSGAALANAPRASAAIVEAQGKKITFD
ncbi:rna binding protein rnp24 [Diplodia corticola]|uniref:Rna binding protein rnp24 n=1 Tax=Diplodia corticola TaxID=236234 RepID=A0A1J9RW32_9PEZI|nr:rna binding protein rnp24 [Diplodia corticola]OJD31685.1 rna binding protein rnp24 [Diplodia corticola]